MSEKNITVRFAPSPTGYLHLGHVYSALLNYRFAKVRGGHFLLRIEDIDTARSRPEYVEGIYADLAWLGLEWEQPVRRQSEHFPVYQAALDKLEAMGLLYPCFCSRRDIRAEIRRSGFAPHGPEGPLYPGICRNISVAERLAKKAEDAPFAVRLNLQKCIDYLRAENKWPLTWQEDRFGFVTADPAALGDVVLARKETPGSYHLAVTLDDHLQGVTHIIRGEDLRHTTHIHRLMQALLDYHVPHYSHHDLLAGPDGKRFAKRDQSATIRSLRERGLSPAEVIRMTGLDPA